MSGFELIDGYDTLNTGRIALNNMYSGMTIYWSGGTGTDSLIRNNNSQTLKNRATSASSFAGGTSNSAQAIFAMAFWGSGNTATTTYSTIVNGKKNYIEGSTSSGVGLSSILNGSGNTISGNFSTILNGVTNTVYNANHSTIVGGYGNLVFDTDFMTIIGGSANTISGIGGFGGKHAVIVGGYANYINSLWGTPLGAVIVGGTSNLATGEYSVVLGGIGNHAQSLGSVAMGGGAKTSAVFSFSIGGVATTTPAGANNTITFFGSTGVGNAEGGFFTGPADIAEMFQFEDNNPNSEDRRGLFVSLTSGGTIKVGNENIIGVVSANPGYIGDAAELKWAGAYLKDKFGGRIFDTYTIYSWTNRRKERFRIFQDKNGQQYKEYPNPSYPNGVLYDGDSIPTTANTETIDVPRINPEFNPNEEYIPRSKRKEWAPVGLLGKIHVKTSEEITGTHIDVDENGMAINGTKYAILNIIKPFSGSYGIVQIFLR